MPSLELFLFSDVAPVQGYYPESYYLPSLETSPIDKHSLGPVSGEAQESIGSGDY